MEFILEICADSLESAENAQIAGANRIELCTNLSEGGTTPSFGTIAAAREILTIGLHVLIRPRGGDFLYSDPEFNIMRRDIETCGELGADGVVLGMLLKNGDIDVDRTSILSELAYPMSVTFHRAFDLCSDPVKGLRDIITTGASRLLTSGQKNKASEGLELIIELVKQAGSEIIIMPGSGLDETNIGKVAKITGAHEFHLTARSLTGSGMLFKRNGISMGSSSEINEYAKKIADSQKIINIINTLKMI